MSKHAPANFGPRSFAYSMSQCETGWRWSVFDEEGVTVALGANDSQAAAMAAVTDMIGLPVSAGLGASMKE